MHRVGQNKLIWLALPPVLKRPWQKAKCLCRLHSQSQIPANGLFFHQISGVSSGDRLTETLFSQRVQYRERAAKSLNDGHKVGDFAKLPLLVNWQSFHRLVHQQELEERPSAFYIYIGPSQRAHAAWKMATMKQYTWAAIWNERVSKLYYQAD